MFDRPESPWQIVPFARSTEEDQYLYVVDRADAEWFLRQFRTDAGVMAHLRQVLAPTDPVYRWGDEQVIRVVASRLSTRRLFFRAGPRQEHRDVPESSAGGGSSQQAGASAPPPQQSAPKKEKEKTWIGVRVVDQRGRPVKDVRVQMKLTDGQVVIIDMAGEELEPDGSYRTEKVLDPGLCEISFPDLDASEWKPQ